MKIVGERKFKLTYRAAGAVLEANPFYMNLLEECYSNQRYMEFIIMSNNIHKIPPVKTFARLYEERILEHTNGAMINEGKIRQAIGSFFGYIFEYKLGMHASRTVRVSLLGITTGSVYSK